jgi:chromate transport protein ChrA
MLEVDLTKGAHAGSRLFTPPWKPAVVIMLFVLALKHFGEIDRALPVLSGITALALTFVTKWRLRRRAWFWIVMSIFVLAHVPAVVFAVRWERWVSVKGFGLVALLDWLVMIWILGLVGRERGEHVIANETSASEK